MPVRIVLILIAITALLPTTVVAVELGIGIGLSDGSRDDPSLQRDYARLQQDIRSLQTLERHLDKLSRDDAASLKDAELQEWQQQSEWLRKQSEAVRDLVNELDTYLTHHRSGVRSFEPFDYQAVKLQYRQKIDAMQHRARSYEIKGAAALQRQSQAQRLIGRTL